ncbi:hypothetical protein ONS95_006513 [Cadophora gregata]|uniref:uncharacterized protein n=1 Tax=Cadophora gregata TaxID=51156 RepID=UPI0026DCA2D9|nr:uncharacterized protein ONS95_006513 [Cadophora gregata]KAK0101337.1 hypothetical protein ONS95_006513 [Cadophora gregata]KAK0106652.1 hypothetical protein ONS96_004272 [Cadophora gregata f. sp. sojae]
MDSSNKSFFAINCCAFCDEQFPLHCVSGPNAWQSVIRAVLDLNINGERSIELTKSTYTDFPRSYCDVDIALAERTETITLTQEAEVNQTLQTDGQAFCFHSWCYSILSWEFEGCSASTIYRLAQSLVPDPSIWQNIQEKHHFLNSASRLALLACHKEQPLFMSRLPLELRTYIWRHTGLRTPYSAFLLVRTERSRLVGQLSSPPRHGLKLQQTRSWATMVSIFGTEYIQDLTEDGICVENRRSTKNATQFRYITSLAGLCAIQSSGDGWEGNWIRKIPSTSRFTRHLHIGLSSEYAPATNPFH